WRALEPTRALLAAARKAGLPEFYTTRHADTGVRSTHRRMGAEAESLYHIKEELAPMPGELVVYKERASGFLGTPLVAHLRKAGVDSLIIFGESTSGCVRASTVDAYSYGFHNVVVEECTYDRSMLSHKVNLFDLHHKYADVMHVDEVIEHLNGLARGRNAAGTAQVPAARRRSPRAAGAGARRRGASLAGTTSAFDRGLRAG